MANQVPTTVQRESCGSMTFTIGNFAAGATSLDQWVSGIPGILTAWSDLTVSATATVTNGNGIVSLLSGSNIVFRFDTNGETMPAFQCMVLSKS